jgi:hypothetical protein
MPYKLRKAPKRDLYWVITIETGKKHSKDPIPKEKAKAQMRILKSALKGGMMRNPLAAASRDQDAKKVIQRILNAANSARAMSITMAEGHKSMEKIMNEAALELAKSGNSAAVEYLNDLRAPYEQDADYTADDSTSRNKIAKQMGLEVKGAGGRNLRGGITPNEFHPIDEYFGRLFTHAIKLGRKPLILRYVKEFFNLIQTNMNYNQHMNPRLGELITELKEQATTSINKLKFNKARRLFEIEDGSSLFELKTYSEFVELLLKVTMKGEIEETDILENYMRKTSDQWNRIATEKPVDPEEEETPWERFYRENPHLDPKNKGKGKCHKCGLPRR